MIDTIEPKAGSFFLQTGWLNYLIVMGISLWGGFVSYFSKKQKFNWGSFIAHQASSSFAGLMGYFACLQAGVSGPLMGVVIGVVSYSGTPALVKLLMKMKDVQRVLMGDATK